ncbi:MAG TPA: glycosyltransferase, partial [Terriglobales bacterium]
APNLALEVAAEGYSAARRFWFEQRGLPGLLRRSGADVLVSAGNFAIRSSPVPQILLSGNALYFSKEFACDLLQRGKRAEWLDLRIRSWFAKRSLHWADCTVAPSEAFARQLESCTGRGVRAVHHGFDERLFRADPGPLPDELQRKIGAADGTLRLLHVSHYNYFRNLETLFRALPLLKKRLPGRKVKLVLTCELRPSADTAAYDPRAAAGLIQELGIDQDVVQLGVVPYRLVHHVYRACHIYVTAAYAESFAHPTVEAMSCGLPVVASDLAVHREICREAALYAPCFAAEEFAGKIAEVAGCPELSAQMSAAGTGRARQFSWQDHVSALLNITRDLQKTGRRP